MRKVVIGAIALVLATGAMHTGAVAQQSVRDFYAGPGSQMRMVIRTTAGGGYDLLSRLLARHMGRFIPGEPSITPVNMPGGGGIVSANYMGSVAPKDGTVISIFGQGLVADQALALSPQLKVDLRQVPWIANVTYSNQLLVVHHTSQTKTLEDAKKRVTTIGTTGSGSASTQFPAFFNNVLGTKFRMIFGYPGGAQIDLAMERGEVEGRGTNPYTDYMSAKPTWLPQKIVVPLIQTGLKKEEALPDVPLLLDQKVKPEDRPMLEFMSRSASVGRPLGTTPGAPPERVAALRAAFQKMIVDPDFIADAKKHGVDIRPMTGEELAKLIGDVLDAPDDVKARVKQALQPAKEDIVRR
jgi:tripartite-type tricarboxylate transporter receptor subunit TctC